MASADKETVPSTLHALGGVTRSRRARRIGIGLLIFIVLFGLLGFFAAPPLIRHIAEQQLSKQLDRPATIQRIALNPYTLNLEADGIHLGDKGGQGDFIDIAKLVVRPSWSSLFRGAPIVNEVRLDSPRFHIVRYDAQRFNFTDLIEKFSTPSPKTESKPTQFSVSNIQVNNGRIDFDDRLLNESTSSTTGRSAFRTSRRWPRRPTSSSSRSCARASTAARSQSTARPSRSRSRANRRSR